MIIIVKKLDYGIGIKKRRVSLKKHIKTQFPSILIYLLSFLHLEKTFQPPTLLDMSYSLFFAKLSGVISLY